ncbi:serine hydrolase [Roseomonas sp. AR75]|uniref:serine hydrolase domain-containing protein n=1 Tax=Roseomonas sp. AR75 TaxID=2562311 RepID=UPI0010C084F8|nr:serine hydrolase domain-containing protein [Roseomonas sp. AR75]
MQRRHLMQGVAAAGIAVQAQAAAAQGAMPAPEGLEDQLRSHLAAGGVPALAAAVVQAGRIVALGAIGTRRAGTDIPVARDDRWHIGSDTKAMTATIAATMVEAGLLTWETTIGQVFPDIVAVNAPLAQVQLVQLLSHTSGLAPDDQAWLDMVIGAYGAGGDDVLNLDEMRLWLLRRYAPRPLAAAPGSRWAYANMNYVIAGSMMEHRARSTWEEMMVQRIFAPLGLTTAGLGPQARRGFVDAPLAHAENPDGTLKPILAGPNGDVPAVVGPAGAAHLSILDFAAWAGWNAGEGRRGPALVKPETLKLLHTARATIPPRPGAAPGTPDGGGSYCLGWGILGMPFSTEPFVTHTGSNTMNLAMVFLQPRLDFAMVMATNAGTKKADTMLRGVAEALYTQFGPAKRG